MCIPVAITETEAEDYAELIVEENHSSIISLVLVLAFHVDTSDILLNNMWQVILS